MFEIILWRKKKEVTTAHGGEAYHRAIAGIFYGGKLSLESGVIMAFYCIIPAGELHESFTRKIVLSLTRQLIRSSGNSLRKFAIGYLMLLEKLRTPDIDIAISRMERRCIWSAGTLSKH